MNIAPSKIGADTYASRFGNWHKALEAFVLRMNQGDREFEQIPKEEKAEATPPTVISKIEIIKIEPNILSENRREIGLSLRYKVLSIGEFKCVRCGASPATDPTCKLHVDHILPFSKGGKTKLENLQILCEKCNLGKGNRHSE
jgi:hypothetical protein